MERNFSIGQGNELVLGDKVFDLHNCYDFGGIAIVNGGRVRLWFDPNPEHGRGGQTLVLDVVGLDRLELSGGIALGAVRDLEEIGFKHPDDNDLDWLLGEARAMPADHLIFSFGEVEYVRIHGERAHLEESERSPSDRLVDNRPS